MSKSDKVVPIEQAENNLPATRGDLKELQASLEGKMDQIIKMISSYVAETERRFKAATGKATKNDRQK